MLAYYLFACAAALWLARLLHHAFWSPLSQVPNAHPLAPLTKLWLVWLRYSGQEHRTRHNLHKRLGPVIRLAPGEIAVNCVENGVPTIHTNAFDKSRWFEGFRFYGEPFMFSMTRGSEHAERKRMMASVYSKTFILNSDALGSILDVVLARRFVAKAARWSRQRAVVDLHPEIQAVSMDITSGYTCGLAAGSNFVEQDDTRDYYLKAFKHTLNGVFWHEFPRLVGFCRRLGLDPVPRSAARSLAVIDQLCGMCDAAHDTVLEKRSDSSGCPGDWPVVYAHLRPKLDALGCGPAQTEALLKAEILDHMIAGNDGAGNTLSFLIWQLSRHPDVQQRLRTEMSRASRDGPCGPQDVDALPLLDAVIQETLRLHPAGLGPHLRVTPAGSAQIGPFSNIPGGTTVSATAWALHRNEQVFPAPYEWVPERWMCDADVPAMRKWFFAFGAGTRMCIGNHLALRLLKAFVWDVYGRFETRVVDDAGIGQVDGHMGRPTGDKLLVRLYALPSAEGVLGQP